MYPSSHRRSQEHQLPQLPQPPPIMTTGPPPPLSNGYHSTAPHSRSRIASFGDNHNHHPSPTMSRTSLTPISNQDRPMTATYYNQAPLTRDRPSDYAHPSQYMSRSPVQARGQPRPEQYHESHSHPPDLGTPRSRRPSQVSPHHGHRSHPSSAATVRDMMADLPATTPNPPSRTANPMSMASILSDDIPTRPTDPPMPPVSLSATIATAASISRSPDKVRDEPPPTEHSRPMSRPFDKSRPTPRTSDHRPQSRTKGLVPLSASSRDSTTDAYKPRKSLSKPPKDVVPPSPQVSAPSRASLILPPAGPPGLTVLATEEAYNAVEERDLSDVEAPGFEGAFEDWKQRGQKRALDLAVKESNKRKRRRTAQSAKYLDMFNITAEAAREIFILSRERGVEEEVKFRDVEDEKERKKDMQRKRRRERTLQNETQKRDEAIERLQTLEDEEERAKILKDVQRAGRKIKNTEDLLQGKTITRDRDDTPKDDAPDSSQILDDATPEPTIKTKKPLKGIRLRKSKEQKVAEKENAAAGQALLDDGGDLSTIAVPKEEARITRTSKKDAAIAKEAAEIAAYTSKGYNQIYEQIWRDLSRYQINKVWRIRNSSLDTKLSNLRKTGQLAAKEARRWQLRTNKSTKDVQARAKRSMREMLQFWKKNERDERDQRKMAERQELENAKKAEADREAARQKRKLNFLISQTELYSHFIGKKVKTDELERSTDNIAISDQTNPPSATNAPVIDLPVSNAALSAKVTKFDDLDFDAEDETALQQAAMANAQNAVKEAQDRARAFNEEGQLQSQFDDGEMNFQNPTSLQNMDVEQPKMLTCQLKEYQIKGLNWLVNLYEQGINGILADEMGLGKTVQSISVMAHLAEAHNIWGPFLVIAPASTLHNWQQEITKFVPTIKVLPYWGNAKDRKVLRKFWDRKHITYNKDSAFHVLVTSYQLVVQDTAYFQKIKWQYMVLDEAQAIKSSQSSRWKALLGFHCRNRLLLTGTPIQNNMQELWALLHFIMPSLFDSHDEFSDWFSKDIESHAQSNTKLNEDQLKRLHMILKPFMLRRVKKHVQKELGDKVEEDVFCSLTYRQRALYTSLRNKISLMDLIEKAAVGDDQDAATLMNLVMQFRKVCNHPDLFERAEITSPLSVSSWAETASFMREGHSVQVSYSVQNLIEYWMPKLLYAEGRLDLAGPRSLQAGWRNRYMNNLMSVWDTRSILESSNTNGAFAWLRFVDASAQEVSDAAKTSAFDRATILSGRHVSGMSTVIVSERLEDETLVPACSMLNICRPKLRQPLADITEDSHLGQLFNISWKAIVEKGLDLLEACAVPKAQAPPIELVCPSHYALKERETTLFSVSVRRKLYPMTPSTQRALIAAHVPASDFPVTGLLPSPGSEKQRFTKIQVPSMRRFVTDSGKLAQLDILLKRLKEGGHRVLLYFQMTRMIDLMEEYLTYRNYKYCRLDGSTKLEDRRDTVAAFQGSDEIFVFLLSTRAGGLGINLTAADTVIFYDSDWNPTIDSQAMDRAHRLGQTRQVTVYRLITRGTIEERIRKRALQKEEVQRVVISGGAPSGQHTVDFNARSKDNRTKDIAMWLADDDEAAAIEQKEAELAEMDAKDPNRGKKRKAASSGGKRKEISMDDMYHEGEGRFDDDTSNKPSGAATPVVGSGGAGDGPPAKKKKGVSKKAKTIQQRLAVADGQ